MSTPRWLDEGSDADGFERSVLASGLDADPPPRAENEVWQRVLGVIAPPLGPGPGGGAAGAGAGTAALTKGATLVTLGKGFLLGVAASLAVAGVERLTHEPSLPDGAKATRGVASAAPIVLRDPSRSRDEGLAVVPSQPASLESSPPELPLAARRSGPANHPAEVSAPAAPTEPVAASRAALAGSVAAFPIVDAAAPAPRSRLDEEAALLRKARAELRSGALAAAFATLAASRERFSAPELDQEREALLIELLSRGGQHERARERARAFLSRYPESPHAAAVRAFAERSP